jgi:hypothetical protein
MGKDREWTTEQQAELSALLEPNPNPKTYRQILAEGVPNNGGLRMLAEADDAGVLYGTPMLKVQKRTRDQG